MEFSNKQGYVIALSVVDDKDNIITINGKSAKVTVTEIMFKHLIINEVTGIEGKPILGVTLPTIELAVSNIELSFILSCMSINSGATKQIVKIQIDKYDNSGNLEQAVLSYKLTFKATNIDSYSVGGEGKFVNVFYGILYYPLFTDIPYQKAFEDKSSMEVIKEVIEDINKSSKIIDFQYLTSDDSPIETESDKMNWIQPNIPNYLHISSVLKHSKIGGDRTVSQPSTDLVLATISSGYKAAFQPQFKLLPFISTFTQYKKDPTYWNGSNISPRGVVAAINYGGLKPDDAWYNITDRPIYNALRVSFETCSGDWAYILSDNTITPIVNMLELDPNNYRELGILPEESSLFSKFLSVFSQKNKKEQDTEKENKRVLPVRIWTGEDNKGEGYEAYWQQYTDNQKVLLSILHNMVYVEIGIDVSDKVKPLDFVYFTIADIGSESGNKDTTYSGVYVVLKVSRHITVDKTTSQVLLCRP